MDESANTVRDIDILTGQPMLGVVDGEPLFVINLCAAMTPQNLDGQVLPGLEQYKLYQVSRMEDGRRRYRLRLGFFITEADAEDVLESVRKQYATAFTACLCDEDLKHASGYLKRSIQDLARTGRFKISPRAPVTNIAKPAVTSDTTIIRNLKPTITPVIETQTIESKPQLVDFRVAPKLAEKPAAAAKPVTASVKTQPKLTDVTEARVEPKPVAKSTVFPAAMKATFTPAPTTTPILAPIPKLVDQILPATRVAAPKGSLMRRAHALETLATARGDRHFLATGKYPAHTSAVEPSESPETVTAISTPTFKPTPVSAAPVAVVKPTKPVQVFASKPIAPAQITSPTMTAKPMNAMPMNTVSINSTAMSNGPMKLEAAIPPPTVQKAPLQKPAQPFHVGAGIDIPDSDLSLAPMDAGPVSIKAAIAAMDTPSTVKPASPTTSSAPIATTTSSSTISPVTGTPDSMLAEASHMEDLMRARELAKQSTQWRQQHGEIPTLDTTQTIRTLTKKEIEDTAVAKWFTVQLAVSDHPVNLDTMPRLDIFEAYNLYSVAMMEGEHIRHALRLGFFREEVSAQAVLGYLKTFFNDPIIQRIADAEHDRFANSKANLTPRPDNTPKPAVTVIELEQKRPIKSAVEVPTINNPVNRTNPAYGNTSKHTAGKFAAAKTMPRAVTPATKSGNTAAHTARKPVATKSKVAGRASQRDMLEEARLLGLSETAILRVQKNPSLLSRLVGKLGK